MEQEKLPYIQFQMISLYRGHVWELKNKAKKQEDSNIFNHLPRYTLVNIDIMKKKN